MNDEADRYHTGRPCALVLPAKMGGLFRKNSRLPVGASAYGSMATMIASRRRLTASSFDFGGALWRGSRSRLALRRGLRVADRLGLNVTDRLGLRIVDRLGQHRMQLSLGRCGRLCHFATISLSTSQLPSPTARPSIAHNFSRRLPALLRIPLPPSVYWRAELKSPSHF